MIYVQSYLLIGCLFFLWILFVDIHAYFSRTSILIIGKEELCQSTKYNFITALIWPIIPILILWPEGD